MRWFAVVLSAALTLPSALAEPVVPERQSLVSYLDSLAEPALTARAAAVKALATQAAVERHQGEVRKKILALLGGLPDRNVPLNARITGSYETGGLRVEKVVFDSLPGFRVTGDVFVPEGKGPFPAVVIAPGHGPTGKAGLYQSAVNFARAGFVVLSYDVIGAGERLEHYDPELSASRLNPSVWEHSLAAYQSMLVGQPVARYFINDAMRAVDYLQSRADVDRERIGAFGCSGGGTVTAYVAALDPRIKATATACFVTTMHDLLTTIGPQEAEQSTPGFTAAGLDLADWVELAAPRAYAIVSTTEDMFPFAGAKQAHDEAAHVWKLYGAADKLQWITGPGRHGNLGPIMPQILQFFVANLKGSGTVPPVIAARPGRPEDLLVTPTGQLTNSFGNKTVQMLAVAHAAEAAAKPVQIAGWQSLAAVQERLRHEVRAVTHALAQPGQQSAANMDSPEVRDGARRQAVHFRPAQGPAFDATVVTPGGTVKGRMLYLDHAAFAPLFGGKHKLDGLLAAGWQVLVLDPVQGPAEDNQSPLLGLNSTFALRPMLVDRTLTGLRVDQAIEAANWLTAQGKTGPLAIYGIGPLGLVALHAAVLDGRFAMVVTSGTPAAYRFSVEQPISRDLPEIAMPNVLLHYDVPDLLTALAPRRVIVIDPIDASGRELRQAEFEKVIATTLVNDTALSLHGRVQWAPYEPEDLFGKAE